MLRCNPIYRQTFVDRLHSRGIVERLLAELQLARNVRLPVSTIEGEEREYTGEKHQPRIDAKLHSAATRNRDEN